MSTNDETPSAGAGAGAGAGAAAPKAKLPPWTMPQLYSGGLDFWQKHYPLRIANSLTRNKDRFVPISGKRVLWYMCGPTVYDSSHLGHARTYLSFDILRRIMVDYFGYDVLLVMNITDIDDKIIDRANRNGEDFTALARRYEKEYMDDMASLGIAPPDVLTRVSEYMPEIIEFVETIMRRGYAYESNGSVYFDREAFSKAKNHVTGKLVQANPGNSTLLAEGEGHAAQYSAEKRHPSDFALWKKSKEGEPKWESPWGEGRPGWHIECSAMASSAMKEFAAGQIDIHSGGWDLRFPHHENEIAQTEAYFDFSQWVNYFVHSGHLDIDGCKMSKSLKNFITIRQALKRNSARQLRLFYLTHHYAARMDYSVQGMEHAVVLDNQFAEFFLNMKALLRSTPVTKPQKWAEKDKEFAAAIMDTKVEVHQALADDFDTPRAMRALQRLVKTTNAYVNKGAAVSLIIRSASEYMTKIFKTFGLIDPLPSIGYQVEGAGSDVEETMAPLLNAFAKFRDDVRGAARSNDVSKLLALCDELRDSVLPALGVRLEDRADAPSVWKLVDADTLAAEEEAKQAVIAKEAARKEAARAAAAEREAARNQRDSIPPTDFFKTTAPGEYSQFDETGLPTHDAKGEPVSKGKAKKLQKLLAKHAEKHARWLTKQ